MSADPIARCVNGHELDFGASGAMPKAWPWTCRKCRRQFCGTQCPAPANETRDLCASCGMRAALDRVAEGLSAAFSILLGARR